MWEKYSHRWEPSLKWKLISWVPKAPRSHLHSSCYWYISFNYLRFWTEMASIQKKSNMNLSLRLLPQNMNILMLSEFTKGPFSTLEHEPLCVISSHYCVIKIYLSQCNFPNLEPFFSTVVFNRTVCMVMSFLSELYWAVFFFFFVKRDDVHTFIWVFCLGCECVIVSLSKNLLDCLCGFFCSTIASLLKQVEVFIGSQN